MRIGILGSRGIPNTYGGFEQFASRISVELCARGHEVYVYNSSLHPYRKSEWQTVHIIHRKDFENRIGTIGQFIYDFNCILDARQRDFDLLLQLGYTSNSVWHWLWPRNTVNIINMDGFEWKRTKYSWLARKYLKKAERWAANHGDYLVADSPAIKKYISDNYGKMCTYVPYGADIFHDADASELKSFDLHPHAYYLVVCRMEPENNIELIINGYLHSSTDYPLVIVGNFENQFGKQLRRKYTNEPIKFLGFIHDQVLLNNLRFFSRLYFHGHSVGGTNPSLLEAMACNCNIVAHDNIFNKQVLTGNASYFLTVADVTKIITAPHEENIWQERREKNLERIKTEYSWERIVDEYETMFFIAISSKNQTKLAKLASQ